MGEEEGEEEVGRGRREGGEGRGHRMTTRAQ
jgi:hypothetical protein